MLPRTVFLLPLQLAPGRHDVMVEFPGIRQKWTGVQAPAQG
jgi:hypothetical protein